MRQIKSTASTLRDVWADTQQRKTLMWVIAALGLLIVGYGVYTIVDGQLEYMDRTDEIDEIQDRIDGFVQQFPTTEVDGETKPDLRDATQEDVMLLAVLEREKRDTKNSRVEADNQRRTGVRIVGIGVLGLALAYLVAPERKPDDPAEVGDEPTAPPG